MRDKMVGTWPLAKALLVGGGALAVLGAFMPWAVIRAPFIGQISVAGSDGDGKYTAGIGLIVAAVALARSTGRVGRAMLGVLGALVVATAVYDMGSVSDAGSDNALVSVGFGLYVTLAAGIAMVGGAAIGAPRAVPQSEDSEATTADTHGA